MQKQMKTRISENKICKKQSDVLYLQIILGLKNVKKSN